MLLPFVYQVATAKVGIFEERRVILRGDEAPRMARVTCEGGTFCAAWTCYVAVTSLNGGSRKIAHPVSARCARHATYLSVLLVYLVGDDAQLFTRGHNAQPSRLSDGVHVRYTSFGEVKIPDWKSGIYLM